MDSGPFVGVAHRDGGVWVRLPGATAADTQAGVRGTCAEVEAMITPRPDTLPGRVLRLLVAYPGELRAADIAEHLYPRPRRITPYVNAADYRSWQGEVAEWHTHHTALVSRAIGRLQEAGLVERLGRVRVAAWFAEDAKTRGVISALDRANPRWPAPSPPLTGAGFLVHLLIGGVEKSPGDCVPKSGAGQRTYARLVEWGVLVAPSQRVATEKGRALVAGWAPS